MCFLFFWKNIHPEDRIMLQLRDRHGRQALDGAEYAVLCRFEELLGDPLLQGYALSERRAIVCHHAYLNFGESGDVDLVVAIADWESGPCKKWRHEKMRLDRQEQMNRILRYRETLLRAGRKVTAEIAAREWIEVFAASWRASWERQPDSTPVFFPYLFFNFFCFGAASQGAATR